MTKVVEYLTEKRTLTGLTNWMNETFKEKQTGTPFTFNDVQQYISRGCLPGYLGGNKIVKDETVVDVKLYNVLK